jgi:hypothetical protein
VSTCRVCDSPTQLFLCRRHADDLRDMLTALAHGPTVNGRPTQGLLNNLADVVLGRTRMGGGSGHRKRGDERPALWEPDTEQGRQTPQGRAETLLHAARNTLTTITRDLCEHRGITPPDVVSLTQIAMWLAHNVHAVACDEAAGQWWAEVSALTTGIERAVDRPNRRVWLGACPTWDEQSRTVCGVSLWAPQDAIEITCRQCHQAHNCDRLRLLTQGDLRRAKITWEQVRNANRVQPDGYRVPERTLRHWRVTGRLRVRGWLRPDGSHGIAHHTPEDEPLYSWPDVERLRSSARHATRSGISPD